MTTAFILFVVFIATLVRATLGFGESLVAVPLLALCLPITTAVPLSVLLSVVIAAIVVIQDGKKIHNRSAGGLLLFTLLGIPVGLWLLQHGSPTLLKTALGALLILFSAYVLLRKPAWALASDQWSWLFGCGLIAGILSGLFGLNGPPLVVYGSLRRWSAPQFRATLQAYFLPASLIAMAGYWYQGLWTPAVTHYFLISLPVVIPTVFLGRWLNSRLKAESFFRYVYLGLIVLGALLLSQVLL